MTDTTTVPQGNGIAFIAWGPDHPDWDEWWRKAGEIADEHEMCPEYERLVGLLGGVPRAPKHADYELVTMRLVLDIQVRVSYEERVDEDDIVARLYAMSRSELREAITEQAEVEREEDE